MSSFLDYSFNRVAITTIIVATAVATTITTRAVTATVATANDNLFLLYNLLCWLRLWLSIIIRIFHYK